MPHLQFRIKQPYLSFEVNGTTERWHHNLKGICVRPHGDHSLTVKHEKKKYDGFGAKTIVQIKKRPPRSEDEYIKIDDRDRISVWFYDQTDEDAHLGDENPHFEASISLPPDAYQRVIDNDWSKQHLILSVRTMLSSRAVTYGHDPNGDEVEWTAGERSDADLESFSLEFCSATEVDDDEEETAKPASPLEQVLASVERATKAIGELRSSVIMAAWLLATVVVVTAFIK